MLESNVCTVILAGQIITNVVRNDDKSVSFTLKDSDEGITCSCSCGIESNIPLNIENKTTKKVGGEYVLALEHVYTCCGKKIEIPKGQIAHSIRIAKDGAIWFWIDFMNDQLISHCGWGFIKNTPESLEKHTEYNMLRRIIDKLNYDAEQMLKEVETLYNWETHNSDAPKEI